MFFVPLFHGCLKTRQRALDETASSLGPTFNFRPLLSPRNSHFRQISTFLSSQTTLAFCNSSKHITTLGKSGLGWGLPGGWRVVGRSCLILMGEPFLGQLQVRGEDALCPSSIQSFICLGDFLGNVLFLVSFSFDKHYNLMSFPPLFSGRKRTEVFRTNYYVYIFYFYKKHFKGSSILSISNKMILI